MGAALGMGTLAAEASAARLTLMVAPATVHAGSRYTVSISGTYDKRAHPRPYLVAFIQYSGRPCKSTATAEYALPSSSWTWAVFPKPETKSPFKSVTYWKAARVGSRRVCVYLYPGRVGPRTKAKPLAEVGGTGAVFRVTPG